VSPSAPNPSNDLSYLAPLFRQAVQAALDECKSKGLSAIVYEGYRSNELQQIYYARGRTNPPPPASTVTNAPTNLYSWHGYGLAVDVVHETLGWDAGDAWIRKVADVFKTHACKWGGDWIDADPPHFQWGKCRPSPSDVARELLRAQGVEAVWAAVGASSVP
jgi:hypothetical protein